MTGHKLKTRSLVTSVYIDYKKEKRLQIRKKIKMQVFSDITIQHNWRKYIRENQASLRHFNDQDLCTPDHRPVQTVTLPWELVYKMMNDLFCHYLYTFNYDLALDLVKINKPFLRAKYKEIYGPSDKASYVLYLRLRSTFRLLEDIHDHYIQSEIYTGNRKPYIRVESKSYVAVAPWEYRFDNVIVMYNDMRPISQARTLRSVPFPIYGSMVLLDTDHELEIKRVHHPLIDILWCNQSGECNQTYESLCQNLFQAFGVFLKKQYAPYAKINYVLPNANDNPFLVSENSFLTIN